MLLQDELRPHFKAITEALKKKGVMPRAVEAQVQVTKAFMCVTLVDAREAYLKEALTYVPGTICIYLEGDLHRPVRRNVLRVTKNCVVVDWPDSKKSVRRFDRGGAQVDPLRDHQKELDRTDPAELQMLFATVQALRT